MAKQTYGRGAILHRTQTQQRPLVLFRYRIFIRSAHISCASTAREQWQNCASGMVTVSPASNPPWLTASAVHPPSGWSLAYGRAMSLHSL